MQAPTKGQYNLGEQYTIWVVKLYLRLFHDLKNSKTDLNHINDHLDRKKKKQTNKRKGGKGRGSKEERKKKPETGKKNSLHEIISLS